MKKKLITIGLAVVGSFALAVLIMGLNPTNATAKMSYAKAAAITPGSGNTDLYVMDTSGAGASIVVDYYPYNSATSVGQKSVTLNAYGSIEILSSDGDVGLGDGFRGTAIVASNVEVAVAAISKWPNDTRAGAYTGFREGAQTQYMPFLNYQPNVRDWSLAVFNIGSSDTTITMTYFNRAGDQDFVITDNILAGQQGYYDSAVSGAKVPTWSNSTFYNTNGYWTGGIKIEADGADDRIVAVMTHHYQKYSGQYGGISSGDPVIFVPYLARRLTDSGKVRLVGSNVSIQNLSGATAVVTTTFIDNQTEAVSLVIHDTIPAYSLAAFNTIVGGPTHAASVFNALDRYPPANSGTDEWVGSAIIESDGADLAVVLTTLRLSEANMGQYAAGGQSAAATECFYPAAFRIGPNTTYNQIRLQNPGTVNATDVDFHFYSRSGTETTVAAFTNRTINAEKSYATLLKLTDFDALGTNWTGGIRITSDQPLICTTDLLMESFGRMASYEATGISP
jgi:hypothetical protein